MSNSALPIYMFDKNINFAYLNYIIRIDHFPHFSKHKQYSHSTVESIERKVAPVLFSFIFLFILFTILYLIYLLAISNALFLTLILKAD